MSTIKEREKQFALRLREEREKLKISQLDLALKAGLSQNIVNFIETGKRVPNLNTILKICDALSITPDVLFATPEKERDAIKEEIVALVRKL